MTDKYAQKIEDFVFEELPSYQNLSDVSKVEKMVGYGTILKSGLAIIY